MEKFCPNCGAELKEDSQFCPSCGKPVDSKVNEDSSEKSSNIIKKEKEKIESVSTFKYLGNGLKNLTKGYILAFKNKRFLVLMLIIAIIWIVFSVLPILGYDTQIVNILNYITFASAGVGLGIVGIIGGIFGKIVYAYFLIPLFLGINPFKGFGTALKNLPKALTSLSNQFLSPFIAGLGFSLISYNFFNADLTIENSMIGIIAFILAFRTTGRENSFWKGFLYTLNKDLEITQDNKKKANLFFYGLSIGFIISIGLTFLGIKHICYILGIILLIASVILKFVNKTSKQEVTV